MTPTARAEPGEPSSASGEGADERPDVHESLRALLSALDASNDDVEEPLHASLLRRALPGRDVVRKVRDAGLDTLEEVLGTSRETLEEALGARLGALEEVLGAGRQTLEALRKEVTAAAREGASRSAREVLEAVMTSTRSIGGRAESGASTPVPTEHDSRSPRHDAPDESPPSPRGEDDDEEEHE